jgi:hypothetical protein
VRWCESFRPRMGAFYRPERWASRVVWGGGAPWPRVKRRKGEGSGGWYRAAGYQKDSPARQELAGFSNSEGSLGGMGCHILGFPARFR